MERGLSFISSSWRNWQQWPTAMSEASRKLVSPKSYPSQRPCPVCHEKTFYVASWSTFFTGFYNRTCSACGYCDPRKVKMIKQL
jgi:hypothetical protein